MLALDHEDAFAFAAFNLVVHDVCFSADIAAKCDVRFYIFDDMIRKDVGVRALFEKYALAIVLCDEVASGEALCFVFHDVLFESFGVFEDFHVGLLEVEFGLGDFLVLVVEEDHVCFKRLFEELVFLAADTFTEIVHIDNGLQFLTALALVSDVGTGTICKLDSSFAISFDGVSFDGRITKMTPTNHSMPRRALNKITDDLRLTLMRLHISQIRHFLPSCALNFYPMLMTFLNLVAEENRIVVHYIDANIIYLHLIKSHKRIYILI